MKFLKNIFKVSKRETEKIDSLDLKMEEANRIIVIATSTKNNNINKSIELIKGAISIFPDNSSYFKLANYLYDANRKDESFETFNELLQKFSYKSFISNKNMMRSEIFKKKAIIEYKDRNYEQYIIDSCLSLYNWSIGLSVQGRKEELNEILKSNDIIEFMTKTKVNKALKEKKDTIDSFSIGFSQLLHDDSSILRNLSNIYNKTDFNKAQDFEFDETLGEHEDKILLQNEHFNDAYSKLSESKIENFVIQKFK